MYSEEFAIRLARLRNQKGVSARDMSLSIGQNAGYINNIENGKALPSMAAFFFICDYLNITPAEFFESKVQSPEKIRDLTDDLALLDEDVIDCVAKLVRKLSNRK